MDEWMNKAACRGVSSKIFHLEKGENATIAKRICSRCPVQSECLEYAILFTQRLPGIWGGTNEKERKLLRQQRKLTDK